MSPLEIFRQQQHSSERVRSATKHKTLSELSFEDSITECTEADLSSQAGSHFAPQSVSASLTKIEEKQAVAAVVMPRKRKGGGVRSILKRPQAAAATADGLPSPILHNNKRGTWKALPPPDLRMVRSRSMLTALPPRRNKNSRRVSFKAIEIRLYNQTLGDHPSTSYGPPISLDWTYAEAEPISVDHYERARGVRRNMKQMMMNYYTRKNTLIWTYGHSEEEIKAATKRVSRIQFQRGVTKYFLPVSKVEEVARSAGRTAKKVVVRSSSKQQAKPAAKPAAEGPAFAC